MIAWFADYGNSNCRQPGILIVATHANQAVVGGGPEEVRKTCRGIVHQAPSGIFRRATIRQLKFPWKKWPRRTVGSIAHGLNKSVKKKKWLPSNDRKWLD